jgi:diguanylate cyclase (GGDEF)-like protein
VPEILMAGAPPELATVMARRLPEADIRLVAAGSPVADLASCSDGLLILDQGFASSGTPALLTRLRRNAPKLPVIYCLDSSADAKHVRQLILELGVNELLFYPLEADTLAQRAAALLGIPCNGEHGAPPGGGSTALLTDSVARGSEYARSMMLQSLDAICQAVEAAAQRTLDVQPRELAAASAHRLAACLEALGLTNGSPLAREIEGLLIKDSLRDEISHRRFSDLVVALRLEIESALMLSMIPAATAGGLATALIVGSDQEHANRLADEALAHGAVWESASSVSAARDTLGSREPDAVLIDSEGLSGTETLELLSDLAKREPPLPAILLTGSGSLMDRVEVIRRGARGFISRTAPPDEIVDAAAVLRGALSPAPAAVLAVDDDTAVLEALEALITSAGMRFAGLNDPLRFWDALQAAAPDLLLLDLQMPGVSGIDLCRVARNDSRWVGVPVVFLTAHGDAETVRLAFAAGADDFVIKPIVGLELLARINNRLERSRLGRGLAEYDSLTGLINGLKSRRTLQDFLRLADRHAQPLAFAVLGVDRLSHVNREYGNAAGDDVLRCVGRLMRREFRGTEVAARWGGNHFVVGMYGLDRQASVRRLETVAQGLEAQSFVGCAANEFRTTLSAGVAGYPDDADGLNELYRRAEEALRLACGAGGNVIRLARPVGNGPALVDVALVSSDGALCSLLPHDLEVEGYGVRVIRTFEAASRILSGPDRRLRARVLVFDTSLPESDGLGLLQQLALDGVLNQTRVIMLTSPSIDRAASEALAAGAADLVARPFSLPVLLDRVHNALDSVLR